MRKPSTNTPAAAPIRNPVSGEVPFVYVQDCVAAVTPDTTPTLLSDCEQTGWVTAADRTMMKRMRIGDSNAELLPVELNDGFSNEAHLCFRQFGEDRERQRGGSSIIGDRKEILACR